jgi:SAM-dependent methyltransferase
MNPPCRICPRCGASDEIGDGEAVWPPRWRCRACGHGIEIRDGFPILAPALADAASDLARTMFDPAMFQALASHEDGNFWFVPRNRLITRLLDRYFPAADSFMEVGCGSGFVLSAVAGMKSWRRVIGSELHPAGLAIARSRVGHRAEFVQMDARAIPAREAFDVIGAFDVIEHIEDDAAVLAAMHRAVRTDGGIMLAVPQHPWLWSRDDEHAMHVRRYRRGELERKVAVAGFRVLFSGSYTALLLPLMAASRYLGARRSDQMRREFELPHVINRLFRAVLQCEATLTLAGVHFPVGGSRLIVAAKQR